MTQFVDEHRMAILVSGLKNEPGAEDFRRDVQNKSNGLCVLRNHDFFW